MDFPIWYFAELKNKYKINMWPVFVVYVTITSLIEVVQLIVKHPFFLPHTKMVRQLWTQRCDKFKTDNTSNLPHILHAFFCEVCDIGHPWLLKETPMWVKSAGNEQRLSFLPSYQLIIYAQNSFSLLFLSNFSTKFLYSLLQQPNDRLWRRRRGFSWLWVLELWYNK